MPDLQRRKRGCIGVFLPNSNHRRLRSSQAGIESDAHARGGLTWFPFRRPLAESRAQTGSDRDERRPGARLPLPFERNGSL